MELPLQQGVIFFFFKFQLFHSFTSGHFCLQSDAYFSTILTGLIIENLTIYEIFLFYCYCVTVAEMAGLPLLVVNPGYQLSDLCLGSCEQL